MMAMIAMMDMMAMMAMIVCWYVGYTGYTVKNIEWKSNKIQCRIVTNCYTIFLCVTIRYNPALNFVVLFECANFFLPSGSKAASLFGDNFS